MWRKHFVAAGLTMALAGCGGQPAATPTPAATSSVAVNVTETSTATPAAGETSTETPSGTETPEDLEYKKLKKEAESLTLGKGFTEALPLLKKCLETHPDDPQIHFYLMLANGNLEAEPSPKSEAYANAKKLIELAPGTPMAERANDYIISAESEAKPMKDLDVESSYASHPVIDQRAMYAVTAPGFLLPSRAKKLNPDMKKKLWYLEINPDVVTDKIALGADNKVSILSDDDYTYSRNSWRNPGQTTTRYDETWFYIRALYVNVEEGPEAGKQGWLTNYLERFSGYDEKANPVFTVKVGPRIPFE